MWICEWLCPKRKHKQGPYDVHEETFQMDEQLGDPYNQKQIEQEPVNLQPQPQSDHALNQPANNPQVKQPDNQQINQKKFIENKNKIQQEEPPVEQPKPKPKYNILPSKIKKKVNLDDYRFINEDGAFKVKKVNTLNQQQFNIENCKNCQFFVFDVTANLYIDDTQNCFVYIAPCESTIFVRNCKNLVVVAITGQFRTFQCHNCHFSLLCKSQPVIESSSNLYFSSFTCPQYPDLENQLTQTKLSPWNNNWTQIHNFTPKQGQTHHQLTSKPDHDIQIDWTRAFEQAELEMVKQVQSVVPFTQGRLPYEDQQFNKALLIFNADISGQNSKIIDWLTNNNIRILRSHKSAFDNNPAKILVLHIGYNPQTELDLSEVDNPVMITSQQQIEQKSAKYFINFEDER